MPRIKLRLLVLTSFLLYSVSIRALDGKFLNVSGKDTPLQVLEKLGAPKGSTFPAKFKVDNTEISVTSAGEPEQFVSIEFSPPVEFPVSNSDLFMSIEGPAKKDVINATVIVADPKSGRIFNLTPGLKLGQLDLVAPWASKEKLKTLKDILQERKETSIIKKKAKK